MNAQHFSQSTLPLDLQQGNFLAWTLSSPETAEPLQWTLPNGTLVKVWDTGVIVFEPIGYGQQDIVLSCGIHGNETAPIELCDSLVNAILRGELQLTKRVLFLFGNPPAIIAAKRELIDNMNRFFSGHHGVTDLAEPPLGTSFEKLRCARLEHYVSRFYQAVTGERQRYLYDLHTAIRGSKFEKFAVYPFLHGAPWSEQQFRFLAACEIRTFLLMQTPASTFSYYAAQTHQAHAFTLELGKVQPMGQNDMQRFAAIAQTLRAFISGQELVLSPFDENDFQMFEVSRSIVKQTEDFALCFASNIENFTQLPVGTLLATDGEQQHRVETFGEAIIFPNANVAIGQRAMLLVKPVSVQGNTR